MCFPQNCSARRLLENNEMAKHVLRWTFQIIIISFKVPKYDGTEIPKKLSASQLEYI